MAPPQARARLSGAVALGALLLSTASLAQGGGLTPIKPGASAPARPPVADPGAPAAPPASLSKDPAWKFGLGGRVRASYDWVTDDPDVDFVGDNNGFDLRSARLDLTGDYLDIGFDIEVEAATDQRDAFNTPEGELDVRARDAYLHWTPHRYLSIALGQHKAGFDWENWRDTTTMPFASRAVGQEGVASGNGFEEPGVFVDRELGVRVMAREPIELGPMRLGYVLSLTNGNRLNQSLDDDGSPAFFGRVELGYEELVTLGGGLLSRSSLVGTLPNQFEEQDTGWVVDLRVMWEGLEVMGQYMQVNTEFVDVGTEDRLRIAYHAQAFYKIEALPIPIGPGYRYAVFEPWSGAAGAGAGGVNLDAFKLTYHTVGLRVYHPTAPLQLDVNYTLTQEEAPRELDNDRLEILGQVAF